MNDLLSVILQGCSCIGVIQTGRSYACTVVGTERSVAFEMYCSPHLHLNTKYHLNHHPRKL